MFDDSGLMRKDSFGNIFFASVSKKVLDIQENNIILIKYKAYMYIIY